MTMNTVHDDPLSLAVILTILFFDIFIYQFLTWFARQVVANEYGTSRPLFFMCSRSYWCPDKIENLEDLLNSDPDHPDIEQVSSEQFSPSIQIRRLRKEYTGINQSLKVAVDNMTVDFYDSEITALLGHNGAGIFFLFC